MRPAVSGIGFAALLALLAGCQSIQPVQPWEKATLAKDTMKAGGPVPEVGKLDQVIYPYREQAKGGTGIGGAGCGCN